MKLVELSHAKMSHLCVHAPLFRSFERGEQKRRSLDIEYLSGPDTYRFSSPTQLGVLDLRIFQGIIGAATAMRHSPGGVKSLLRGGRTQREHLKLTGCSAKERVIASRFFLSSLLQSVGYARPSGDTLNRAKESIKRLSAVTVSINSDRQCDAFRLISISPTALQTGEVSVCLNPNITAAILGNDAYLRLDLSDVRKLHSDAARLLHSRLHWINPGNPRTVSLKKLCSYIYADTPASSSAASRRKSTVKSALNELENKLGWGVKTLRGDLFEIQRPKAKHRPNEQKVVVRSSNNDRPIEQDIDI